MSAITVKCSDFLRLIRPLKPLFPKGTSDMPIGMYVRDSHLRVTCVQGCVYQAEIPIDDALAIASATVIYKDISDLVPTSGELTVEFANVCVEVTGSNLELVLPIGYSVVEEQDFTKLVFSSIDTSMSRDGLNRIIGMGLEKLYGVISPISIKENVSLQRFQNIWVQTRTIGLGFESLLDTEHIKLILNFGPTQFCRDSKKSLVFKNSIGYLQVPCSSDNDKSVITELMQDLGDPITLVITNYLDKVRQISKLNVKAQCKVVIYEKGLKTVISQNNITIGVATGDTQTKVLSTCSLPISLWVTMLKGLDAETIQVLVGGGKICLRTQYIIILARALL